MLRRRPDNTYEFRVVELVLRAAAPPPLTPERREALRLRIMAQLGAQDAARRYPFLSVAGIPVRERWVAVPAGIGIAAAIILTVQTASNGTANHAPVAHASLPVTVDGVQQSDAHAGQLVVAKVATWLAIGDDVRIGMHDNSGLRYSDANGVVQLSPEFGSLTVASTNRIVNVQRGGLILVMQAQTTAQFSLNGIEMQVSVAEGAVTTTWAGTDYVLGPGDQMTFGAPGAQPVADADSPADATPAPTNPATSPEARPEQPVNNAGADSGGHSTEAANPPAHAPMEEPEAPVSTPTDPNPADAPKAPANSNAGGNASNAGTPPANSNAGGNASNAGTPPANSNAGGNSSNAGNPPANSNAGGNSSNAGNPPANSDAGGNASNAGTRPANANAGGNSANAGNPPANSNAGGNSANPSNPPANSNAGGNSSNAGTPPANANAGGNASNAGNPPANSNSGGNQGKKPIA
jgi:hypothetical protein